MHILIAPDSFKECLSAAAVAKALQQGWLQVRPDDTVTVLPTADGGEGTVEALVVATKGVFHTMTVSGPLGVPVEATYGILGDGATAVIEMAAASGLGLVPVAKRNPLITTTRGTGELIRHALDKGINYIILGIGGSATNDGGAGMAQALGYSLKDKQGNELESGGAALAHLDAIDTSGRHLGLDTCEILVACDVDNPLCGPRGASVVYGPQKGATPAMVQELDAALAHYAQVLDTFMGIDILNLPGAGAAGGLGGGLVAFADAILKPGVDLVAEACGLDMVLAKTDLVITGEGRIDAQTLHGKTVYGIAQRAAAGGIPVIAVGGALEPGYENLYDKGVTTCVAIGPETATLAESLAQAEQWLIATGEQLARMWLN